MSKAKRRRGPTPRRPVPVSQPGLQTRVRLRWIVGAAVIAAVAAGAFLIAKSQADRSGQAVDPPATGLPDTPDYHSLLVSPDDPERLFLGTHAGLYESTDGGRSWSAGELAGNDAMNLARTADAVVWAAGHDVLARSDDGGKTWSDVRPDGLPSLDLHGFASDSGDPSRLYAAVVGQGLYRSTDAGESFEPVSQDVGPAVFGLAVLPDGRLLAGDGERGLTASDDGGASWTLVEEFAAFGIAVNPADPDLVLAAGQGPGFSGILVSRDGGRSWEAAQTIEGGAGPLAWAPGDPDTGYAVGFDGRLYRSDDRGASWQPVA